MTAARPRIVLVAAMAKDRTIAKGGKIPWRYPEDLRFFKEVTMGTALVMGRKTYDSIGRALPGRLNVVVTRDAAALRARAPGVEAVGSLAEAYALAASRGEAVASVIGGGEIYREAMPQADEVLLTEVPEPGGGDVFFPVLDPTWREASRERRGPVEIVRWLRR
jgi:dihydrofolate reductase